MTLFALTPSGSCQATGESYLRRHVVCCYVCPASVDSGQKHRFSGEEDAWEARLSAHQIGG